MLQNLPVVDTASHSAMAQRIIDDALASESDGLLGSQVDDPMIENNMEQGVAVENSDPEEDDADDSLRTLMGRLRCLFGALTCPIPPLAVVVGLALFYFVGVAFVPLIGNFLRVLFLDQQFHIPPAPDCGRPLFLYAWVTLFVAIYTPHHVRHRQHDKLVHSLALVYVYFGLVLVQSCSRDDDTGKSCSNNCPLLAHALNIYVASMEIFTVSLFVPLLVLPCIYVWFLRQADQERTMAALQERYGDRGSSLTVTQVLEGLRTVELVEREDGQVSLKHAPSTIISTRECCICMTDLVDTTKAVVQTSGCSHLFHKQCLASWIGGRWEGGRRARRTTCPLCRAELQQSSYGSIIGR